MLGGNVIYASRRFACLALKGSLHECRCYGRLLCGTIGRREAARPSVLAHRRALEQQQSVISIGNADSLPFRCSFPPAAVQLQREGHARLPATEAVRCC